MCAMAPAEILQAAVTEFPYLGPVEEILMLFMRELHQDPCGELIYYPASLRAANDWYECWDVEWPADARKQMKAVFEKVVKGT